MRHAFWMKVALILVFEVVLWECGLVASLSPNLSIYEEEEKSSESC